MAGFEMITYGRFWVIAKASPTADGVRRSNVAASCSVQLPAQVAPK
jgi:hypothetical protein